MKVVKVKDKLGIVMIESRDIHGFLDMKTGCDVMVKSLNNVLMEDGTTKLVGDEEMEVIDDNRSKQFIEEIEKLYSE